MFKALFIAGTGIIVIHRVELISDQIFLYLPPENEPVILKSLSFEAYKVPALPKILSYDHLKKNRSDIIKQLNDHNTAVARALT